jgi:two-component system CAI-1 autoinducer sensor kinase/phosphatase CqsS
VQLGLPALALARTVRTKLQGDPLEPILHPTPWRLRGLGLFAVCGHPLFGWVWLSWLPQPWESPLLRAAMVPLGLPLVLGLGTHDTSARRTKLIWSVVCWLELPVFFSWMYLCNGGNTVWLASVVAMLLIYYHLTDWRLATLGTLAGGLAAWLLFGAFGPDVPPMTTTQMQVNGMVIGFAWTTAFALGLSSANLRREHLRNTLATVGIMAHELRTPLATIALVGDVLQTESREMHPQETPERLAKLSVRMHSLVRGMHHQIDAQIANARLLNLPPQRESVAAGALVQETVANYPFRSTREREGTVVQVRRDFRFTGSSRLFAQVLDNLIKNALKAIAGTPHPMRPGDLLIEVGVLNQRGRIIVSDQGGGIGPDLMPRIFEPFFSTDQGQGHGLGLAFCRRVVNAAGGSIHVRSAPGRGATFTIELPVQP